MRCLLALIAAGCFPIASVAAEAPASDIAWPAVTRDTKPWTRWWWFGNIADEISLTSEMERYAAAGFGGLEITPIYGVRGYEERFVSFLSPRWMELFAHTLAEAHRLDLGIDLATGTGWPFGGPWLEDADAAHYLAHRVFSVKAGERLRESVAYTQTGLVRVAGPRSVQLSELKQPVSANDNLQELALDQVRFETALPLVSLMAYPSAAPLAGETNSTSAFHSASPRNWKAATPDQTADQDQRRAQVDRPARFAPAPIDLTSRVRADGTLDWTAPDGAGAWTLYALFQGQHGKMVERAAPGGEGFALDHLSSSALKNYLARFDTAFRDAHLSSDTPAGVRAYFNDSYEVDDATGEANWTPRFLAEFAQRRGYDLRTRLPELFSSAESESVARVRSDYRETISDLLLDEFTRPWRAWAQQRGALIRNQAHNAPANILDLYAASDIPEQEGNGFLAIKLASSAAHITGKPLASAETATWLDEHFLTTLAALKANADGFLLAGINHLCYHGTPFSPPDDPWPGFQFYASVEISPANPLWENLPALNAYLTRAQSFLQSEPDSCYDRNINLACAPNGPDEDVLLYYNIHDRWAEPGDGSLPHFGHGGRDPVGVTAGALAAALHAAEVGFDYVSDRLLLTVSAKASAASLVRRPATAAPPGAPDAAAERQHISPALPDPRSSMAEVGATAAVLHAPGARYRAIVVPATTYMPETTLAHLVALAADGATILVHEHLPRSAPGLRGAIEPAGFDRLIEQIRAHSSEPVGRERERLDENQLADVHSDQQAGVVTAAIGRGRIVIAADLATLLSHVPGLPRENLRAHGLEFVRRHVRGGTAYFLVNRGANSIAGWIPFATASKSAALFDPMTGATGVAARRDASEGTRSEVYLQLAAGASCIVRFHPAAIEGPAWTYWRAAADVHEIAGPWSVAFTHGGPLLPAPDPIRIDRLQSWTEFAGDAGRAFSGTAVYSRDLARPPGDADAWSLDLGTVCDSAQVSLNGRELATLIQPPWRVTIPASALRDRNTLEVAVTNLAANRIADLDRRGVPWKKFYNANMPAQRRENVGPDGLFTAAHWLPRNSGLLGPVRLTPLQNFDPARTATP